MKSIYFFFLLLILGACTTENDLTLNQDISDSPIPAAFLLGNSERSLSSNNLQADENLILSNDSITISMEQEAWSVRNISQPETRTSWTNSSNSVKWLTGDQVGIFMREVAGNNAYLRNNALYTVAAGGASTASLISNTNPLYFIDRSTNAKFYAYYPYSAASNSSVINYVLPTDQSDVQNLAKADILYASTGSYNGSNPNVALNFNHQMTLLTFNIRKGLLSGLLGNLSRVAVSGTAITNKGTLDLAAGLLTPSTNVSDRVSILVNTNQSMTGTARVDIIINPCVIVNNSSSNQQIKVDLTFVGLTGNRSTNLVTTATFAKGMRYTYNISLTL